MNYKITHAQGSLKVTFVESSVGCTAQLTDHVNEVDLILTANTLSELYDKCRCWASNNIRGEFMIEATNPSSGSMHVAA